MAPNCTEKVSLKSARLRLLVYDDGAEFGGLQKMALTGLRSLLTAGHIKLGIAYFIGNERWAAELASLDAVSPEKSLTLFALPHASGRAEALRAPFSWLRLYQLRKIIRTFCPDRILVVQGGVNICNVGLLAGWLSGISTTSYLPMCHQPIANTGKLRSLIRDIVYGIYYRLADRIITVSDQVKNELAVYCPPNRISVVLNGIDPSNYHFLDKQQARQQLGLQAKGLIIAVIGRLDLRQKGQDLLLEAIASSKEGLQDVSLVIVGDGPDCEVLKRLAKEKKLLKRIHFLGWQQDLSIVYSAIDLMVMPSHFEAWPLALLEALYFGLPVVASDIAGIAEMLPKSWLFMPGNSLDLANTLQTVLNSDTHALSSDLHQKVKREHSLSGFAEKFSAALFP